MVKVVSGHIDLKSVDYMPSILMDKMLLVLAF